MVAAETNHSISWSLSSSPSRFLRITFTIDRPSTTSDGRRRLSAADKSSSLPLKPMDARDARRPRALLMNNSAVMSTSYAISVIIIAGSAAEEAATRKTAKYSNVQAHRIFQPGADESLGQINASGRVFLSNLGRKLADQSGDERYQLFISATIRSDLAVQCHFTA